MALTVFDAVGKFSADTSELDQFIAKLERGIPDASGRAAAATRALKQAQDEFRASIKSVSVEGGNTAENMQRLADAEKSLQLATGSVRQEHESLRNSLGMGKKSLEDFGGSSREARGAIMLLGEEIGVRVPRHVAGFIAGLPGVQTALSAAFAPVAIFALIEIGGKLIEKIQEIRNHAKEVADAWQKVQDGGEEAFQHTGDQILGVEKQLDELNHDKLGALQKNLELIDHASLADLAKQIQQIQKDTDDAFTKMQTWWDWITTMGTGNTGIKAARADFDDLIQKAQNLMKFGAENPDPFGSLKTSLDGARQKVVQLQEQQKQASGEQVAIIQQEIDAQNKKIAVMNLFSGRVQQEKDDLVKLNSLREQQSQTVERLAAQGSQLAGAVAQELAGTEKTIDAKNKEISTLGLIVGLQLQALKLEEDKVKLATTKKDGGDPLAAARALLDAQQTVGTALLALVKQQDIERINEVSRSYSLENAATKLAYSEQLDLIANADLQKRAVQAKADDDAYNLQLNILKARLDLLKKSGKDTSTEQTKLNAEIEALQFSHQAKLVEIANKGMDALRKAMSQPVPFINEVPAGVQQVENEVTQALDKAEQAAQGLGITLRGDLNSALQKAYDNYSRLDDALKKGVISEADAKNGYIALVKAELDFAKASGASVSAIKKLEQELKQLQGTQDKTIRYGSRSWDGFFHEIVTGSLTAGEALKTLGELTAEGIGASVQAALTGSDGFVEAFEKMAKGAIAALASEALIQSLKEVAHGFSDLANPLMAWHAPAHFLAAAKWGAVAGAAAVVAVAIPGGGGGGRSSSSGGGVGAPGAGSPISTSSGPSGGQNVPHVGGGGMTTGRRLAMIGDDASGTSDASEAILPLTDKRAMQTIADAILPGFQKAIGPGLLSAGTVRAAGSGFVPASSSRSDSHIYHVDNSVNVQGIISDDNLDKVLNKASHRVSTGRVKLLSSNSMRVTRRS